VANKKKFRIIASPFHMAAARERATAATDSSTIPIKDAYDIWDLVLEYLPGSGGDPVPIPNGRHTLEVAEMVCSGREAILVLQLRPNLSLLPGAAAAARRSKRMLKRRAAASIDGDCDWSLLFDLTLTSCGPSNLVELDIDRIRGRFWELEGYIIDGSPLVERHQEFGEELGTPSPPAAKRRRVEG
jgi:hypothetical protein